MNFVFVVIRNGGTFAKSQERTMKASVLLAFRLVVAKSSVQHCVRRIGFGRGLNFIPVISKCVCGRGGLFTPPTANASRCMKKNQERCDGCGRWVADCSLYIDGEQCICKQCVAKRAQRPTPYALDAANAAPVKADTSPDIVPAGEVGSPPRQ